MNSVFTTRVQDFYVILPLLEKESSSCIKTTMRLSRRLTRLSFKQTERATHEKSQEERRRLKNCLLARKCFQTQSDSQRNFSLSLSREQYDSKDLILWPKRRLRYKTLVVLTSQDTSQAFSSDQDSPKKMTRSSRMMAESSVNSENLSSTKSKSCTSSFLDSHCKTLTHIFILCLFPMSILSNKVYPSFINNKQTPTRVLFPTGVSNFSFNFFFSLHHYFVSYSNL